MSLKEKSEENLKAATWAEENEMYNVAVSRLYYSMFQKLKFCLKTLQISYNGKNIDSHEEAINALYNYLNLWRSSDTGINTSVRTYFKDFKKKRVIADYNEENVCASIKNTNSVNAKRKYEKIKILFDFLVEQLDKYIEGV
jgi:hypothetical protein